MATFYTALVPTVPSPCFLRQSSTVAKVRETFCVSFVLIRFVIGELLSEVGGRVGHGLVLAWFESYVLRLVFLDSSLQSPGQEKDFGILFIPLRVIVREQKLQGSKLQMFGNTPPPSGNAPNYLQLSVRVHSTAGQVQVRYKDVLANPR